MATSLSTPQSQTCIVCHTPHNADDTMTDAPLWNHEVTAVATYTLYDSTTLDATDMGQPNGVSKLCLSCHDGTVAVDNYGDTTTGTIIMGAGALSDTPAFGADLSNDHPISFTYNTALATADGGLENPSVALSGLVGGGTIDADLLYSGKLECASCHDVHNDAAVAQSLLVMPNTDSDLCLTCHLK
jgi:predicted CXXCH cytochrome family protein